MRFGFNNETVDVDEGGTSTDEPPVSPTPEFTKGTCVILVRCSGAYEVGKQLLGVESTGPLQDIREPCVAFTKHHWLYEG